MGIVPRFSRRDVTRVMNDAQQLVEAAIIRNLEYVGEHAVTIAREQHARNYTDRTGNLRASVGYGVLKDGVIVSVGGFDPAAARNRTDGATGARDGRDVLEQLKANYPDGFVLIVVAGRYYGGYVERRNYNVVTFTKTEAERKANSLMKGMFRML